MKNRDILEHFFSALQRADTDALSYYYDSEVHYNCPLYGLLQGDAVMARWKLFFSEVSDYSFSFGNIQLLDEEYATVDCEASYLFIPSGKKIIHPYKAFLRIQHDKITEQSDAYSLQRWAAQAFGFSATLIGWTGWYQRRLQKKFRKKLQSNKANHL
ncbi:MAG: nuclear transport factor 2 family protein [Chitinophagaceae bacterium]|nr:nuclear transport factor 2 family protein [Chitinophagaceae bacterium]